MWYKLRCLFAIAILSSLYGCGNGDDNSSTEQAPPNILFFILDDVGIDQMQSFGYGGATPPETPNINAIADVGVSFRNMWAMPECSPSRALVFEGRYPLRTNVTDAILADDLANSQVSPYESTTPIILRERGYQSALFGKFHLTGSNANQTGTDNNPLGFTAVHQLGWDFFKGWQEGAPFPIDTTAGGVAAPDVSYACGFVPGSEAANGADAGACYFTDNSCEEIFSDAQTSAPGRTCLENGGIFVPDGACSDDGRPPANVDFTLQNGYYVGQLIVNQPDGAYEVYPPEDPSGAARAYRSIIESDWAIDWIKSQSASVPWMATVSFSSAHSPFQQPPTSLLAPGSVPTDNFDCASAGDQRVMSNQMIESMDAEIGRVLVETGIATINNGALQLTPEHANTMIIVLGDNGTYAPVVKAPFNPTRAKGTVYQTGVWTPLIVAGSLVKEQGRDVEAMINIADVFQLFGELAGIDVHDVVPSSRQLDSVSMLPYLENPAQQPIREINFAQLDANIEPVGYEVPPCVLPFGSESTCLQLFAEQSLCNSEGGIWWGESDGSNPSGVSVGAPQSSCCAVNEYQAANGEDPYSVQPSSQLAMRDADYKLVQATATNWDTQTSACKTETVTEFYAIDENVPPMLDDEGGDLLASGHGLTPSEQEAFSSLSIALEALLDSNVPCVGDGNLDGVIDDLDVEQLGYWQELYGLSSWYDFDHNGKTNEEDLAFITAGSLPRDCP